MRMVTFNLAGTKRDDQKGPRSSSKREKRAVCGSACHVLAKLGSMGVLTRSVGH